MTPYEHCDLVGVLAHTFQKADMIQRYIDDFRSAGDDELAQFLQQLQDDDRQRVQRTKQLPGSRLPTHDPVVVPGTNARARSGGAEPTTIR